MAHPEHIMHEEEEEHFFEKEESSKVEYLPPVRCYSCGFVIGAYYGHFEQLLKAGYSQEAALDAVGAKRTCCRTNFMSPIVISGMEYDADIFKEDMYLDFTFTEHSQKKSITEKTSTSTYMISKANPVKPKRIYSAR